MNLWEMIVIVVFLGTMSGVIMQWLKNKENTSDTEDGFANEAARRIEDLEERVRVLERLATDKSSRLRDEIDAL